MEISKTTKMTIFLMLITLIARITGLLREIALSYAYGASAMSDAFIVGTSFSTVVFAGIAAAFLNAYIPVAVGKNDVLLLSDFTSNFVNVAILITSCISIMLLIFLKPLVYILAVGFQGETLKNTMIIAAFSITFSFSLCISNIMIGFLQIKGKFLASGMQSIFSNGIVSLSILYTVNEAVKLGIGYALSMLIPTLILVIYAYFNQYKYSIKLHLRNTDLITALKIAFPIFIGQLAMQFNSFIDRAFASTLEEGTVSALKYGSLLCSFVVSIFAVSVATVIYPKLAEYAQRNQTKEMSEIIISSLRSVVLIVAPLIVGAMMLATPIVKLLFERGAFDARDTAITSGTLIYYAFSILGNSSSEVLNRAFFANKDSMTPITRYSFCMLLNIFINACLIKRFGAKGLAFATTLCSLIAMMMLIKAYKHKYKTCDITPLINSFYISIIASSSMALIIWIVNTMLDGVFQNNLLGKLINLGVPGVMGIFIYIVMLCILRAPEVNAIKKILQGRNTKTL